MAEVDTKQVKSKREQMLERMKTRYPEQTFDDDEALMGRINDDYDEYEGQINGYKEREQAIADLYTSDPRSAAFMSAWRAGKDPSVEFARNFGSEALKDPEKLEEIAEANKEYLERVANSQKLDDEYKTNLAESVKMLESKGQEEGSSHEEVDKAMELLMGIMRDAIVGKFSAETIEMALKAVNHDADVADAERAGVVRGRNANIVAQKRKRTAGDGTVSLNSGGGMREGAGAEVPGALGHYGEGNQTIWERGGETRKKMR